MQSPVILFSLPRSGSTLLQRILSVDPKIATVAEPWVLLPLVYALKGSGVYTEYSHDWCSQALADFLDELPGGRQAYLECMGEAVTGLYSRIATKDVRYFLDKTPRYALISDDVISMFPDGKFIFLWRNPLAVISSMIETWGGGKWNIYIFKVDLFDGMQTLVDSYESNREAVLSLKYESLLQAPEDELSRVFDYLDLHYDPGLLAEFAKIRLDGKMGDPTGVEEYSKVDMSPLDKWKTTLNNPLRRMWCRRYLQWIGRERMAIMGYDLDELLQELNTTHTRWATLPGDVVCFLYGLFYCLFDVRIIKQKFAGLRAWKQVRRNS